MKIGVKVGDIMTRNFISVKPDTNLEACARTMIKKRVGSLIVKDENKLKGLLTEHDIIWAMLKKRGRDLTKVNAGDIAKRKVITIKPSVDLYDAIQIMNKSKYRRLPVMINGNVIGMLTLKDILKVEPSLFELASEQFHSFQIREEENKLKRRASRDEGESWLKEGICEECGNLDLLYRTDIGLLCEACREEM